MVLACKHMGIKHYIGNQEIDTSQCKISLAFLEETIESLTSKERGEKLDEQLEKSDPTSCRAMAREGERGPVLCH